METLQEAYQMAKNNNGAPGIDGVTFDAIEESGVEGFLKQIQDELDQNTYQPMRLRKKEIPKADGKLKTPRWCRQSRADRYCDGTILGPPVYGPGCHIPKLMSCPYASFSNSLPGSMFPSFSFRLYRAQWTISCNTVDSQANQPSPAS
jgi:hypothetical protein